MAYIDRDIFINNELIPLAARRATVMRYTYVLGKGV